MTTHVIILYRLPQQEEASAMTVLNEHRLLLRLLVRIGVWFISSVF